ncbi:MAG: NUDIX domain-containing protein [Methanobacteriota archaeon]
MLARKVVTVFLRHNKKILILKRSQKVGSYPGRWAGISGFIGENETPLDAARREVREETGARKIIVQKEGKYFSVVDEGKTWIVHPFLFDVQSSSLNLDWEHETFKWIAPREITKYKTVPALAEALEKVIK